MAAPARARRASRRISSASRITYNPIAKEVLRLSLDLPIVVECVETEENIQAILPELHRMIGGGLITLERAHVIVYRPER